MNKWNRRICCLLCAAVLLSGCGGGEAVQTETQGEAVDTVVPGTLTVVTSPDYAPHEFYTIAEDGTPTLAGFDLALAQYIADYAGLKLDIVTVDFDGVLSEMQTQTADLAVAGLSPDEDREVIMDFSDIYHMSTQVLVCAEKNKDRYPSIEAMNGPEYTVAVQIGSNQGKLAEEFTPEAELISLPKATDMITELLAGKLDGAYLEGTVAASYQKNYPELYIIAEVPYDRNGAVVGVRKGNEALLKLVNEAIAAAKEDGSMDRFVIEANDLAGGKIGILSDGKIIEQ